MLKFHAPRLLSLAALIAYSGISVHAQNVGPGPITQTGGKPVPLVVNLDLEPLHAMQDPGPSNVITENGTWVAANSKKPEKRFLWVDVTAQDGIGANGYRIYFDRQDSKNFHFLDRRDDELVLGLSEEGIEMTLARTKQPAVPATPLRLARHGTKMGVFVNNKLVLSAFDDRRVGGAIGVREKVVGDKTPDFKVEAREEILFADDFMRENHNESAWKKVNCTAENGDFAIKSLRNPLLSANAFNYMGVGSNIISFTGQSWWDNYSYECSLRGPDNGKIGLIFAYQDDKNYGLFRWTARTLNPTGEGQLTGTRELVRVTNGKEEVLGKDSGGYQSDQWYRANIQSSYNRVRILLDGNPIFETNDPQLAAGAIGFWCDVPKPAKVAQDPLALPKTINSLNALMKQHAVFDDVKVKTSESVEDDFSAPGALSNGWLPGPGDWSVAEASKGVLTFSAREALSSKSLIGDRNWSQYRVACDMKIDGVNSWDGLVFLYRDESNYWLARTNTSSLELIQVSDGKETQVDKVELKRENVKQSDGFIRLSAKIQHGHIEVTAGGPVNGQVEGMDQSTGLRGRAGLYASFDGPSRERAGNQTAFRRFRLSFLEDPEPLVTSNAIFDDETSMRDWTNSSKEWNPSPVAVQIDGAAVRPFWHSLQFPGDVELQLEPREVLEERYEVALSVSKNGQGGQNGYVFRYMAGRSDADAFGAEPTPGAKVLTPAEIKAAAAKEKDKPAAPKAPTYSVVQLQRQGKTIVEQKLPEGTVRELSTVSLRRAGSYLIGMVNGKPLLTWRDPEPLSGSRVAYYTKGVVAKVESNKISSEHFLNELFSNAPTGWRTAGNAIAEVTNRWQCDPRWSFFSLKNDREAGKPAVLWSKRLYPGDVALEFFVGNKMEAERGQPYTYARDINVNIAGDGKDLNKGYTFMFGGRDNSGTYILRNGVEVASYPRVIATDMKRVHRLWFQVHIERRGNKLAFTVTPNLNGESEAPLTFEDPEPLTGDRVCLWTYDHAIMISRVRVSGDGGQEFEDPDILVPVVKTPYDRPWQKAEAPKEAPKDAPKEPEKK